MESEKTRLIRLVALCSEYCGAIENAGANELPGLVKELLGYLCRIYHEFLDIEAVEDSSIYEWGMPSESYSTDMDEVQYESARQSLAAVFGLHDTYLETFERDMKYSDTPITATVSENLCDIYQSLYNFVVEVRESEGGNLEEAFRRCKEQFDEYWSQTLCNVMRALNAIRTDAETEN